MKKAGCLILVLFILKTTFAGEKYWLTFTDKAGVVFDPYTYFSERTIKQRIGMKIPLDDFTDYPVSTIYLDSISKMAETISWHSRWLNGVALTASDKQAEEIAGLSFVSTIKKMNNSFSNAAITKSKLKNSDQEKAGLLKFQTQRMKGNKFASHNFDGTGIRIAVFDVGFPGVYSHPAFKHINEKKRIIATYDFVKRTSNVSHGHWHGTATFSCIGGKTDEGTIGLATGAEFILARTERALFEIFSEEENWIAAAEWADSLGANIISSSLGYTYHRYFKDEMNGHTSLVSKAATIAASKGILVVNSAGNDGISAWKTISTPADADSVLTVGGTDPETDLFIDFSSVGPASDGSLKPNVCALGKAVAAKKSGLHIVEGTSFSSPLIAGFAACAWQSNRHWSNMELFNEIEKSSHLFPYFDYHHGFGIPQASYFVGDKKENEPTFDFVIINNDIKATLREEYTYTETEEALGYDSRRNFYFKVEDKDGRVKSYTVLLADRKEMLHFFAEEFQPGDVITAHFEGYTSVLDFPSEENK